MLEDKVKTGDAAHIAEEIINNPATAMRSKCLAVYGVVNDKITSLEKALELYKVPYDAYIDFLAKKQAEEVEEQSYASIKDTMLFRIRLYEKILGQTLSSLHAARVRRMIHLLNKYSEEIQEDKLVLKE
jgi:hypothetical protein